MIKSRSMIPPGVQRDIPIVRAIIEMRKKYIIVCGYCILAIRLTNTPARTTVIAPITTVMIER